MVQSLGELLALSKGGQREYHRAYYYKRDPAKLKKYRDNYERKKKHTEYNNKWRKENPEKARAIYVRYYFKKHGVYPPPPIYERTKLSPEERLKRRRERRMAYYYKHKEQILDRVNFEYRARKLQEFADAVLENVKEPMD